MTKNSAIRKENSEVHGKDNCFSLTDLHDEDMKEIPCITLHAKSERVRYRWIEVFKRTVLRIRSGRGSNRNTILKASSVQSMQSDEEENNNNNTTSKEEEEPKKKSVVDDGNNLDEDEDDDGPPGMSDEEEKEEEDNNNNNSTKAKPPPAPPLVMSKLITEESTAKDVKKLAQIAQNYTPSHQTQSRLKSRARIVRDLIDSEKVYVKKLSMCVSIASQLETFASDDLKRTSKTSKKTQELILSGEYDNRITNDDVTAIFAHLKSLLSVEKQFLDELSRVVPENFLPDDEEKVTEATASIAGTIVGFVPFLSVYVQYASNYATAVKVIERLVNLKRVQALMQKRKSESLALTLARPLQHLTRIRTSLASLVTRTDRK